MAFGVDQVKRFSRQKSASNRSMILKDDNQKITSKNRVVRVSFDGLRLYLENKDDKMMIEEIIDESSEAQRVKVSVTGLLLF